MPCILAVTVGKVPLQYLLFYVFLFQICFTVKFACKRQQFESTVVREEQSEGSILKWILLLIPFTTFGLGTWQVRPSPLTSLTGQEWVVVVVTFLWQCL